jgi:hypothetical protein
MALPFIGQYPARNDDDMDATVTMRRAIRSRQALMTNVIA